MRNSGRPFHAGERLDLDGELLEEVDGPVVAQRVDRVEPQPVAVEVAQPHQRVVDEEARGPRRSTASSRLTAAPHGVRGCR